MNAGAESANDLLTRTTLRFDHNPSAGALANLIRSLQRVPGVLVAELNAVGDRALLAHDGAVPIASLLAAATALGVQATVIRDPRSVPDGASAAQTTAATAPPRVRPLTLIGVAVFVALGIADALVPALRDNHTLSVILIAAVWGFFVFDLYLNRKG